MRARAQSTVRVFDRDAGGSEIPTVDETHPRSECPPASPYIGGYHHTILERLEVRRWPSAKALEQPGAFDLGDHRRCFRARDRAASQGHIVVDFDHHAATTEQE